MALDITVFFGRRPSTSRRFYIYIFISIRNRCSYYCRCRGSSRGCYRSCYCTVWCRTINSVYAKEFQRIRQGGCAITFAEDHISRLPTFHWRTCAGWLLIKRNVAALLAGF